MKKRLVSIIMMSVFACQLVACGAPGTMMDRKPRPLGLCRRRK